jgi:hypothetical protein
MPQHFLMASERHSFCVTFFPVSELDLSAICWFSSFDSQGCKLLSDIGQCPTKFGKCPSKSNFDRTLVRSQKKIACHIHFLLWQNPIANSLNLHFAIKFTRHSSILLNVAPEWLYILHTCLVTYIQLFQLRLSPEQSGKVEYERERLLGIANKWMNLLAIPSSLSRLYWTFPLCSGDNLNWNSCISCDVYMSDQI